MESYYSVYGNSISIIAKHTSDCDVIIPRIANKLIWDVNSFLAKQFDMLEIVFDKFNEYYLTPLNSMYIFEPNISESEFLREYKMHEGEGISLELFKEIYSLEMINSLKYVAMEGENGYKGYFKKRELHNNVLSACKVYVSIMDHDNMTITVYDKSLFNRIIEIINNYAKEQ